MTSEELVKQFYQALNSNDIEGVMKLVGEDIARVEFEGSPSGGTYRGRNDFKAHVIKGRSTWAEGSCTPESFATTGDKIVAFVHVRVRLKDRQDWIEGQVADGFRIKDGKIVEMNSYSENEKALEWMG